ncbi:hypothetical protein BH20ACT2_BH20ACT2_18290 [soil metagenome]
MRRRLPPLNALFARPIPAEPSAADLVRRLADGPALGRGVAMALGLLVFAVAWLANSVVGPTVAWTRRAHAALAERLTPHLASPAQARNAASAVALLLAVLPAGLVVASNRAGSDGPTWLALTRAAGGSTAAEAVGGALGTLEPNPAPPAAAAPSPGPAPAPVPATAPSATVPTPLPPIEAGTRGALPVGKGMWMWLPERIEGNDVEAMVARARAVGLTHIYVRTGSSRQGFYAAEFLDRILPAAHAAGIRVYGWDFPYFDDVGADVGRAVAALDHRAPGGHRLDGFSPDIETPSEGTNLTVENAVAYGEGLRAAVGPDVPLIVTVPRPSPLMINGRFPYDAIMGPYDAIAPMVYWLNRQPDTDVAGALEWLARYGKPVFPIGQAYDGAPEGGRPGPPPGDEIRRFLSAAEAFGAPGVSFWSWQHASQEIWDTYAAAAEFSLPGLPVAESRPSALRAVQVLLDSLGYPNPATGGWEPANTDALASYQRDRGLAPTGELDGGTMAELLRPLGAG